MAKENQATVKNSKFKSKPKKPNRDKEPSSSASSNENKAPADSGSSKSAASSSGSGSGASSVASSSASPSDHSWVLDEILGMMHGFGDSRYPMLESAKLIEDIVTQQMKLLYSRAAEVATLRGAKTIGIEDILFLMRKNKVKLGRLVRYLELKSLKGYLYSKFPTEDSEEISAGVVLPDMDETLQSGPQFKRARICNDFISFIDQTGELADVFTSGLQDDVTVRRQMRADSLTKAMDRAHYMEYSNARASSFCRKNKTGRFREWLLKDIDSDMKLLPSLLDVFSYMAYETVAEIVDLALLVKKEAKHDPKDPLSYCMPTLVFNPEYPSCRLFGIEKNPFSSTEESSPSTSKADAKPLLPSDCIRPEEIKEAMRRFTVHTGPMAWFSAVWF